ncbi:Uncharacterised protein [Streptococcus suis]|uniref:Uncharacterized protein n=1 Tax=Streptococcus suis TaxID=1307 RepID=A0A0Z8GFJ8_STRSU|nr:Uncharacterised protein [Streptococcus suis]
MIPKFRAWDKMHNEWSNGFFIYSEGGLYTPKKDGMDEGPICVRDGCDDSICLQMARRTTTATTHVG